MKNMKRKRVFIGIFGRRNKGKSSLINALTRQEIAIVSDVPGTTTDPVKKSIEILGVGPVVLIDTAGIDDSGEMGEKRVKKTLETIDIIDVALIVISDNEFGPEETNLIQLLRENDTPYAIVHNKSDETRLNDNLREELSQCNVPILECSASKHYGIDEIIDAIIKITPPSAYKSDSFLGDIIKQGDMVVLVMPQDSEAPEGRLILPQVQLIRDILDNNAIAIGLQPNELSVYLKRQKPDLVVTDSQVFNEISKVVPPEIPLTSFSIVLAKAKGNFENYLKGTPFISKLENGDKVLILESCTHTTSCEDIGRVKLPNLIRKFTGKDIKFTMVSSLDELPDLQEFRMAIQCGGCMVSKKQLAVRIKKILDYGLPVSNYGMSIAYVTGIFERVTSVFDKESDL